MKVKDLIAQLQTYDPELEVWGDCDDNARIRDLQISQAWIYVWGRDDDTIWGAIRDKDRKDARQAIRVYVSN